MALSEAAWSGGSRPTRRRCSPSGAERDALRGREVSWEKGSGVAEGIDERGYLVVRLADGDRVALGAGDVHLTGF